MLDNKKYRSYTQPDEWQPFFTAMQRIAKQISKKESRLEKDLKDYKLKYERVQAEKDDLSLNYLEEKERHE